MSHSLEDIYCLLVNMKQKMDKMEQKMDKMETNIGEINTKLSNLEEVVAQNQSKQATQPHIAMVTSISSTEEKIKLLNEQTAHENQEDLLTAMRNNLIIEKSGIYSIVEEQITIYEYVAETAYNFDSEASPRKFIYAFPDTKNVLYYWNNSKKTWSKMNKSVLNDIFLEIQQKIIVKYNELMNEDEKLRKESIESGDLIYVNDFEKNIANSEKFYFPSLYNFVFIYYNGN